MTALSVGAAAAATGWSARMLRYLANAGLVVPRRTPAGYRLYGVRELNQLRALAELRRRFAIGIDDVVFTRRLRTEPELRAAVDSWFAAADDRSWMDWEQRKHERLLAA